VIFRQPGRSLAGAKYPNATNWNDVLNGVNASNLLTTVTLDSSPGTASSGNAVDCSGAFPSFSSINPQAPI
jgi:hypothetical protein